jgi:HB1, ASXL, restriction endonuclease HTH domain
MVDLVTALETSREMIEAALAEARAELSALDARRAELEALIAKGEAALGGTQSPVVKGTMTLHDALVLVLRENNNAPMTARELADAVNDRGLYRKRDGSPVEVNQVHARASNYDALFEKDGALIQLREESPMFAALPQSITNFRDDDGGFFAWLEGNPDGYFVNSERKPKPTYLVLHRSGCPHFTGGSALQWTKDYVKFCSPDRGDLEEWAIGTVGGEVTLCRTCFG